MKALLKKENMVNTKHLGSGLLIVGLGLLLGIIDARLQLLLIMIGVGGWIIPELLYGEPEESV